ncbi:MAG: hypothetical protein A3H28_10045 [Acidobacteria bacterium RIFCSPLOWO2_02_FULL_61_28]|nr:MAG: hypothetical protein A3H28_10045 [Acidobacteria bacterium RIFCSPLOWO2_02_FULL_61_28]
MNPWKSQAALFDEAGRVYISKGNPQSGREGQYFEGISPEVWNLHIGGYQVCEKWLKDRRERTLRYDDQLHYAKVVTALQETIRLMAAIDAALRQAQGGPFGAARDGERQSNRDPAMADGIRSGSRYATAYGSAVGSFQLILRERFL